MGYGVQVRQLRLRFMSAHMATFGGACEPLHGHNYQVSIEVRGAPTADGWVVDFSTLKRAARDLCDRLDHRFLLQRDSPLLRLTERDGAWEIVTPAEARYLLPARDVLPVPVTNTTAEQLAAWFHDEIARTLRTEGWPNLTNLRVEIEEAPGQSAWYEDVLSNAECGMRNAE